MAGRALQIQDLKKKRAFEEKQRIKEMELLKAKTGRKTYRIWPMILLD
jgi:hypothetical protein